MHTGSWPGLGASHIEDRCVCFPQLDHPGKRNTILLGGMPYTYSRCSPRGSEFSSVLSGKLLVIHGGITTFKQLLLKQGQAEDHASSRQ